jgi:hypothetical protein
MSNVILSGGDMGGMEIETDAEIGDEILIWSDAGETSGRTLRYRRDGVLAVYIGVVVEG